MKQIIFIDDYGEELTGDTMIVDDQTAEKFVIDGVAIMSKDLGVYPNKMVTEYDTK